MTKNKELREYLSNLDCINKTLDLLEAKNDVWMDKPMTFFGKTPLFIIIGFIFYKMELGIRGKSA